MKAKEYLLKITIYRYQMERIREDMERLYADAAGVKAIVYDKDRVQISPESRLESAMIRIEAEAEKWSRKRAQYERELRKRVDQISRLSNPDYVELLTLRYIETDDKGHMLTWETIAERMGWSYSKVTHMHGEALQEFARRYL